MVVDDGGGEQIERGYGDGVAATEHCVVIVKL